MAKQTDEKALIADIVKQRDKDGKNWSEIVDNVGMSSGKVMLLYLKGTVKDRFKGTTDAALAKEVAQARKQGLSWGIISVMGGFSEQRARNLFEQATGKSASDDRIGKGGRHPGGGAPAATPKPAKQAGKKAPAAKKSAGRAPAAKKSATKGGGSAKKAAGSTEGSEGTPAGGTPGFLPKRLVEMNVEELRNRLNGKVITVGKGSGPRKRHGVKNIISLSDDGLMEFSDSKSGGVHTVQVDDISKASR